MKPYILAFALLFCSQQIYAQTKEQLAEKQEQIKKEIAYTNELLQKNKETKAATQNQLVLIGKKINSREKLISNIKSNINYLENNIEQNIEQIDALSKEVERLKKEYAEMIYYAYKTKSAYSKLMYVFSSNSFNQAYKRLKYFQQFSEFRAAQVNTIQQTQEKIAKRNQELAESRDEKKSLLVSEEQEKQKIVADKNDHEKMVKELQKDNKKLQEDLKKKIKDQEKLTLAIKRIIAEELERARQLAIKRAQEEAARLAKEAAEAAAAKGTAPKGTTPQPVPIEKPAPVATNLYEFAVTPEAIKLSDDFAGNRGKLAWPLEKGVITSYFGKQPHPILHKVEIENDGVDIGTTEGANARAIFDGVVSAVIVIPGAGKAILVRHGEYLTVYSNLSEVFVKMGDKVSFKQNIGKVLTDKDEGKTELKFQIWKGTIKLNPSLWLLKA